MAPLKADVMKVCEFILPNRTYEEWNFDENKFEEHELLGDRVLNLYICEELVEQAGPRATPRIISKCISNRHYADFLATYVPSCSVPSGDCLEVAVHWVYMFLGKRPNPHLKELAAKIVAHAQWETNPVADEAFHAYLREKKVAAAKREVTSNFKGKLLEYTAGESPTYSAEVIQQPPATPIFEVRATLGVRNLVFRALGKGVTKKDAEQRACGQVLLKILELRPDGALLVGHLACLVVGPTDASKAIAAQLRVDLQAQSGGFAMPDI